MRKVNIQIVVDDDLYGDVIMPAKANKKLSRVIVSLLEGYYRNEYVQTYAETSISDMDESVQDDILRSLEEAAERLEKLGVVQDKTRLVSEEGVGSFSDPVADDAPPISLEGIARDLTELKAMVSAIVAGGIQTSTTGVAEPEIIDAEVISQEDSSDDLDSLFADSSDAPQELTAAAVDVFDNDSEDDVEQTSESAAAMSNLLSSIGGF